MNNTSKNQKSIESTVFHLDHCSITFNVKTTNVKEVKKILENLTSKHEKN